jgi:hypothetical protein
VSTISQEDALIKAKKYAQLTANDALDQESVALQRSVDLASINDTECGLDSTTLEGFIVQIDEKKYKLIKDLILFDLDLIIKKDETLTIPKDITLTNKKLIKNLGKMINYGIIINLNEISHFTGNNCGEFISYKGSSYQGTLPSLTSQSVIWPSGTDLFTVSDPSTVTITNTNNPNIYCISQNTSSSTTTTITLNTTLLPSGTTGFNFTNIQTIGAGGGGGGALSEAPIFIIGNGGCGGGNIVTPSINYNEQTVNFPIDSLEITFNTGEGGTGGTCQNYSSDTIPTWTGFINSKPSNGAGTSGGDSVLTITYNNSQILNQTGMGGSGGLVVDVTDQKNEPDKLLSNCTYSSLPISNSSATYNSNNILGFSGGYGGMSYNYAYSNIDNTNGQPPSAGSYGAGGGSGVAQGVYPDGSSENYYYNSQSYNYLSGGGGGGIKSNVGGLGYSYNSGGYPPVPPSPSSGGGGGGAGINWVDGANNPGQNGGTGYNSITITFVQ